MANTASMPLRIALINSSTGNLPVEVRDQAFYHILIDDNPQRIDSFFSGEFDELLEEALEILSQGQCVEISLASQAILMLPALTAAKLKCHPHAVWVGYGNNLNIALEQARRKTQDVSVALTANSPELTNSPEPSAGNNLELESSSISRCHQFDLLTQLINSLHSRDLSQLEANTGVTSNYWFTKPHQARVASYQLALNDSETNTTKTLILTQGTSLEEAKPLLSQQRLFFVISGNSQAELTNELEQLLRTLSTQMPTQQLLSLMQNKLHTLSKSTAIEQQYTSVLQAVTQTALLIEIQGMLKALPELFANKTGQYKTPAGSYFTPSPTGQTGLAFVYPGVGTVYPKMLNELHQYFPELYATLEREGNLSDMLQAQKTYCSDKNVNTEMSLSELAIAGVGASYLLTKLLTQVFKVRPHFALGYSMGEAGMWASLDVWQTPHTLIEATQTSPIFTQAISGELTSVRQAWQLEQDETITWNSFVVRCAPEPIEALLNEYPRAYLAIIQGDTCVIAGCEESCRALLKKLAKRGIAANRVTAMHTPPALEQHAQVLDFYHQPVTGSHTQTQFISAANNDKTIKQVVNPETGMVDSQAIAQSIADTFCQRLDFTKLVQSCREQGAKLFVEVGADRQTSTLIDKINKADGQETQTATVPMNAKGGDDANNLLKALAQLISHRVPLSITPLIEGLNTAMLDCQRVTSAQSSSPTQPHTQISEGELT